MKNGLLLSSIKGLLNNSIDHLKDEEYQRRVWFWDGETEKEGIEVDSYLSTAEHLLNSCKRIFEDPTCIEYLGSENYNLLKKLRDLVYEHVDLTEARLGDADLLQEGELLDDPKWHDIQALAEEVYTKLNKYVEEQQ